MKLKALDHVALAVRDADASVRWYREVLGLERQYADEWETPKFVGLAESGIALFPIRDGKNSLGEKPSVRVLHFAWRADRENFLRAQNELRERGIPFEFEDHGISHSIYFSDPDDHQIEITTYELDARDDAR